MPADDGEEEAEEPGNGNQSNLQSPNPEAIVQSGCIHRVQSHAVCIRRAASSRDSSMRPIS